MMGPDVKGNPLTILLIEDNPGDARLIKVLLSEISQASIRIDIADRLSHGIDRVKIDRYDAILLDLGLPDSTGLDTFTKLHTAVKHVPIVVLSGLDDESIALMAVQEGAQDYLVKGQVDGHSLWRSIRYAIERKRVDQALRVSEEKYQSLVENANEAIFVAQNGKIIFHNPQTAVKIGYSAEEITEKPFIEFIHPDDRGMVIDRHLKRLKGEKLPHKYVFRIISRNGSARWAELNTVLIAWEGKPATLNFLEDITERKLSEERILKSYESVKKTLNDAINTMVKIVELRDPYTAGHQQKVANLATAIGSEMKLEDTRIDQLRTAAMIHDIGKIHIPSDILSKPGKLADIEFSLIQTHAVSGYEIVKGMDFPGIVAQAVLQHHERLDGSGYPNRLKGEDILVESKILAVADVIEAMSSHRPYRPAPGIDKALQEIKQNSGKLYDPDVVDICIKLFSEKTFSFEP